MKSKTSLLITGLAIAIALLAGLIMTNATALAKWVSLGSSSRSASVAVFAVDAAELTSEDLAINCNTDDTEAVYQFVVSNQKNGAVSEVSIGYTLKVILPEELPSGLTMLIDDGIVGVASDNGKTYTFTHAYWKFEPGVGKDVTHSLYFIADPNILNYNIEMPDVQIQVTLAQLN